MAGSEPDEGAEPPSAPVELTIESLGFGGEAIARLDGMVILVDRAVPGDRILARITQRSRRFARARRLEVLVPSSGRQVAACRHYEACNGCSYQEAMLPLQRDAKRRQVVDLLSRIARIASPPVAEVLTSSSEFHYRRRMTYTFPREPGAGPGLHGRFSSDDILEVPDCLLPEERVQTAYRLLLPDLAAFPPVDRPGRMEIHAGDAGPPVAVFRGAGRPSALLRRRAEAWVGEERWIAGAVWLASDGRSRRRGSVERVVLAGQDALETSLGGFRLAVPAGCFFQANPALAEKVFALMAGKLGEECREVLELYAGAGALTMFLAAPGRRLLAVEGDPEAVRAGRINARENGAGIEWKNLDVREALHGAISGVFDAVVVDPPRTGLPPGCAGRLAGLARRKLLYLSCNPATMARDLGEITAGGEWVLRDALPADFFPHTAEIECLATLERR